VGRRDRRVLGVDDNEPLRLELGRQLEREGWLVTLCPDGPTAVQSAVKWDYDIALIDFTIPGIRGAVVAETIRALNPRACIIGISFQDRRQEFLAAGADAFLLKPFDIEEVVRTRERKNKPII
jgi:CheY-like chemotaxis protein